MRNNKTAEKCFNTIMELQGADEFKALVQRLCNFQKNKNKYSMSDATLPNYLWITRRGGGITTSVNAFTEYLYSSSLIEFTGTVKYFEFKLAYIAPNNYFTELARLENILSEVAGHHRYFKGVISICIDEWVQHSNEEYFFKFLDYLENMNDKILVIFYIHTIDKRLIKNIESSLSSQLRFESISFRFPDAIELVDLIETKYFKQQDLILADDAKSLLVGSIEGLNNGMHFNGFNTINQLANDIIFNYLTTNVNNSTISAEMLSNFSRDSEYLKCRKTNSGSRIIGFSSSREDYSK